MRYVRLTLLLAWLAMPALTLAGCADSDEPTSPVPITALDKKPVRTTTEDLWTRTITPEKLTTEVESWWPVLRDVPVWADIFDNQTIGSKGGTLTAGEVTVTIPRGALAEDTNISMIALQGDKLYVLFWPHGLTFATPASLSFALDNTNADEAPGTDLKGVYFESLFDEVPSALESYSVNKKGTITTFEINHFSYYSVYVRRGYTAAGAD